MKLTGQIERINMLHRLIELENTGTPQELAKKLNISLRQLYRIVEWLRTVGAPVCYNRKSKTYYYSTHTILKCELTLIVASEENHLDKILI